jgi:N-dimethylarginine dimethylaminohydrolase
VVGLQVVNPDGRLRSVLVSSADKLAASLPAAVPASWLAMPDAKGLMAEVEAFHDFLRSRLQLVVVDVADATLFDGLYARDYGAVVNQTLYLMRSPVPHRAPERDRVADELQRLGIKAVCAPDDVYGEGADLLPLSQGRWAIATGRRTTQGMALWMRSQLPSDQVLYRTKKRGPDVPQHLLGGNRILNGVLYHRADVEPLPGWTGECVSLNVNDEVGSKLGMNWLVLDRAEVVMAEDCPGVRAMLEKKGIKVHVLPMANIRAMGGGFACATLPLWRDL